MLYLFLILVIVKQQTQLIGLRKMNQCAKVGKYINNTELVVRSKLDSKNYIENRFGFIRKK